MSVFEYQLIPDHLSDIHLPYQTIVDVHTEGGNNTFC